jgi:hypothetical protein
MLDDVKKLMEAKLDKDGIAAEITFCRKDMFSVLVEDGGQFDRLKVLFGNMPSAFYDSEDRDPEIGNIAFYRF